MRKLRLMFRWTFVFVLLGMLHVHANAYRQNRQQVTLSMKAVSLKDVLWAIERQTSFVFMYNEEDLDKIGKVDVDVQGDDIRTILNVCLRNTNLTYVLQDEVIVIKPEVQSQKVKEVRIKGTVKDEKGHLLPGVTVFIKGLQIGTVTDGDGRFTIAIPDMESIVLQFSFVGMLSKEVKYEGQEIAKGKMVKERMTKGKMGKKARQGMALFLAGLMVVSAVDLSGLRVNAVEMTGVSVFAEAGWEDSQQSVQSTEQDSENQNDSKPGTQNGEQNSTQEASQSSAQNGGQDSENQNVSQFSTQQESKLSTQSGEQNSTQEAAQPSVQSAEQGSENQGSLYFEIQPEIQSGNEIAVENYTAEEAPELTVKAAYSNDSGDSSNGGDSSNSSAGTEISYQWYVKKTVDGTTTEAEKLTEQGADSVTYQIPTGLSVGVYEYYCVAACGADTVTSQTVTFTVVEGVVEAVVNGQTKRYATLEKARDAIVAEINDGKQMQLLTLP